MSPQATRQAYRDSARVEVTLDRKSASIDISQYRYQYGATCHHVTIQRLLGLVLQERDQLVVDLLRRFLLNPVSDVRN